MLNLLIIDDDPDIRLILKTFIESLKIYNIYLAPDTRTAIGLINDHSFDVVITDYLIGGFDGCDFIDYIHSISPSSRVVLITGSHVDIIKCKVDDLILKPFSFSDISRCLTNLNLVS